MPSIHPTLRKDIALGIPRGSVPARAVADAVSSDGLSYGRVDVVSHLCPQRHVCVGHRNSKWFRLIGECKSEHASARPEVRLGIEIALMRTWLEEES